MTCLHIVAFLVWYFTSFCLLWSGGEKEQGTKTSKLLDGSSEFVLTYKDKEGDWMLVGDVPWGYAITYHQVLLVTVIEMVITMTTTNTVLTRDNKYYKPEEDVLEACGLI